MRAHRLILVVSILALISFGCGDDDNGTAPTPTEFDISGPVATSQTWSGTVRLTADADILAGVEIAIAAGTVFRGAQDAALYVHGDLSINGTAQNPVDMQPASGANSWAGIIVESGGVVTIRAATGSGVATLLTTLTGALACTIDGAAFDDFGQALDASSEVAIQNSTFTNLGTNAVDAKVGGDVTITDTVIWGAPGDLVIVSGGALTMSYCDIGSDGSAEHGDIFVSSATGLDVSYSNLTFAVNAVSIGNTTGATFQFNNFLNNDTDVVDLGSNAAISMPNNYWDSGVPALGGAFSISTPAATPIVSAGPRTTALSP